MKEVTQIITCKITSVVKNVPDDALPPLPIPKEMYRTFADAIKADLNADNVSVSNVQVFITEGQASESTKAPRKTKRQTAAKSPK